MALFQPGNPGRPKGAISKRTRILEDKLKEFDCDPFDVLLMFAKGDWEALGYDSSVYVKEGDGGSTTIGYTIPPELRMSAAKELCQYLYPKQKSVEHITRNVLEGMSPEQKLEAMKQAVKMMEGEIGKEPLKNES